MTVQMTGLEHNTSNASYSNQLQPNITRANTGRPAKPLPVLSLEEIAAFWSRCERGDGCWLWTGSWAVVAKTKKGTEHRYGIFRVWRNGKRVSLYAHRVSKAFFSGDSPHLSIDHTCKNKLCINPAHLDWVTHTENLRRVAERNGSRRKSRAGVSKRTRRTEAA